MEKTFFYAFETVDFPLQLTAEDFSPVLDDVKNVVISLAQQNTVIVEKDMSSNDVSLDTENDIVNLHLTQEDTGAFAPNIDAEIQVNILYNNSLRDTSARGLIAVKPNLHNKTME